MPYNTRRKSLSLESLGIHVPNSSRSAHRSPPSMTKDGSMAQPPSKKTKRSHTGSSIDSTSPSTSPRKTSIKWDVRPKSVGRNAANTPPPSPGRESSPRKIDLEGIDDDIVVGVIEQLEKTGNRPHLLKELAAVLMHTIHAVQTSANPAAIISSRLAGYLKRSWSALSPCPLDKVLIGTHPKRVYYFLTTSEPQPITESSQAAAILASRIISPSLSSNADDEEERDARSRARMSPSPEVDLSNPEFDDETGSPFPEINPHPPTNVNIMHNRRAEGPPLEKDEREFSQIVETLQARSRSHSQSAEGSATTPAPPKPDAMDVTPSITIEEPDDIAARRNSEAAAALFGQSPESLPAPIAAVAPSSPMLKPQTTPIIGQKRSLEVDIKMADEEWRWSELKSPENVDLDELEDMFDNY